MCDREVQKQKVGRNQETNARLANREGNSKAVLGLLSAFQEWLLTRFF